jgi:hypothetical protein
MGNEASSSSSLSSSLLLSSSLVDFSSRKQKQTKMGFFIFLIPMVIFPLGSKIQAGWSIIFLRELLFQIPIGDLPN